jgi:membrane protein DedA with SNARE-associated domain
VWYTRRRLTVAILAIFPIIVVTLSYLEDIVESGEPQRGIGALLISLPQEAIRVVGQTGYGGIFLLMLLEAAAFPIPSEIVLPFAGYLVWQGTLSFWPVVIYSTIAAMIGSFVDYYLGLRLGALLLKPGKLRFVNGERLRVVHAWFNRYGAFSVTILRLVPAARVLISFPAGAYQMKKVKFAAYTLAGCLPWNFILVYLGWWFGSSWDYVVGLFRYVNVAAYVTLILAGVTIVYRLRARTSKRVAIRTL